MIPALMIVAFAGAVVLPWLWWNARERKRAVRGHELQADLQAIAEEVAPASLHPEITKMCIGSGACVNACPEKEVIALVHGQMQLVNPLSCVGHGECMRACPVGALTLVFGTATRGVELPLLSTTFETSQPGIYVVGELGGMGLIRNAVAQGRQVAAAIAASRPRNPAGPDVIVVGSGPAGIATALGLKAHGRSVEVVEQGVYGGAIHHYPRAKVVMTGSLDLPGYGSVRRSTMTKEQLAALWDDVRARAGLVVRENTRVDRVLAQGGQWLLAADAWQGLAPTVVLALGRRGAPRQLGVPGEELDKVMYRLLEPEPFAGQHVLIVGGGNSAADCAVALAAFGKCASVTLSYRRRELLRMRSSVRARLQAAMASGTVTGHLATEVVRITANEVWLRGAHGEYAVPNDAVIVQIGGTSPDAMLQSAGIAVVTKYAEA